MVRTPVWVTGMGCAMDRHAFASRKAGTLEACEAAAAMALAKAGWPSAKADVVEASASSAVSELMVLEAVGLAPAGRAVKLDEEGSIAVNRSGGALPADPTMATGLIRLAQATQQLALPALYGLERPASAIVHGAGGVGMQSHCVLTLEV
jgi:acetyl-CoA C-acetyltransferase